jgi:hypothetical protein
MDATCPVHLLLYFIILIIFAEQVTVAARSKA